MSWPISVTFELPGRAFDQADAKLAFQRSGNRRLIRDLGIASALAAAVKPATRPPPRTAAGH